MLCICDTTGIATDSDVGRYLELRESTISYQDTISMVKITVLLNEIMMELASLHPCCPVILVYKSL